MFQTGFYALAAGAATLVLTACGGGGDDAPVLTAAQSCSALSGKAIAAAEIGKPTSGAVVQSAAMVAAAASGNTNGEYCAVKGVIVPVDPAAPNMQFEVNLPSTWNERALQFGGGGFDGSLVTGLGNYALQPSSGASPLAQGFVTLGSDGGHTGGAAAFDGSFGLNDEALLNYGQLSVKKTHDVAVSLTKARYGKAPTRFYFIGLSQGGHEALDAAARYPADFDGVIANFPAYNVTLLHLASLNTGKALYKNGGAGWSNPTKVKLLTDAVYAACDGLDGATDGVVSNISGCNAAFNIATVRSTLRCANGIDTGDTCLSDAQIDAIETIASPYKPGFPIAGMTQFEGYPILEGALFNVFGFGSVSVPSNPPSGRESLLYQAGAATTKYIITRNPALDPLTFDPLAWQARTQAVGAIMDVSNIDLGPFLAKGGKVILTHGTADDLISTGNSIDYYKALVASKGQPTVDSFFKFYLMPGMGHTFGPFNAQYDGLSLLQAWVEKGQAPTNVVMKDSNPGATRTRPMCEYPKWPKLTAGASMNDASSFTCVTN